MMVFSGEVSRCQDRGAVMPEDGELKIDVRGDLAGILTIAVKGKTPVCTENPVRLDWAMESRNLDAR